MPKFEIIDYAVIGIYLLAIVSLGIYFSRRQNSLSEYFHAGGTVPWWAVGVSILATSLSPISYLAGPGWVFSKDSRTLLVGPILGLLTVPITVALWVPLWSRLRVFSIYEYLEMRFHPGLRNIGSILFLAFCTAWVGTALKTAGIGFEQVTGFNATVCIIVIASLGTFYTMLGGLRAVIWTDVAQFVVFFLGYAVILVTLLQLFDWQPLEIYRIASNTISAETGYPHTKLISFERDMQVEATIWVLLFGRIYVALTVGAEQTHVQRLHATGSQREMRKSLYISFIWLLLFSAVSLPASWGFVAFYAQHPELKEAITHTDQVLPDFVVTQLPTMFRSLIMAGVLAALMSSLDSALNSMGSVTVNDFFRRHWMKNASEKQLLFSAKILILFFGVSLTLFSLWQLHNQGTNTATEAMQKLFNIIAIPLPCFFLLGMLSKRTNTPGVLIGAVAGIIFSLLFNGIPGVKGWEKPVLDWFNWMWIAGLSAMVNMSVGYCASFLFPPPPSEVFENLSRPRDSSLQPNNQPTESI